MDQAGPNQFLMFAHYPPKLAVFAALRVVSSRGTSVRAQPGAINMSLARNELRNELEMRGVNEAGQTTTCNHNLQSSRNFTDPNVVLRRPKLLAAIARSKYTCRALCFRSSAGSTPPKGQLRSGYEVAKAFLNMSLARNDMPTCARSFRRCDPRLRRKFQRAHRHQERAELSQTRTSMLLAACTLSVAWQPVALRPHACRTAAPGAAALSTSAAPRAAVNAGSRATVLMQFGGD